MRWFLVLVLAYAGFGLNAGHVSDPHAWRALSFTPEGWSEFFRWLGFSFRQFHPGDRLR